jgi:ankyrin repeat protein
VQGACPWAIDKLGGRTALHYCARNNNVEILQLLIDAAGIMGPLQFPNRPNTK